jgi:pimeloyl-ACP methyl ester carboxylesterase
MNSGQRTKSSYLRGQPAFAALWRILALLAGLVVLPIAAHAAFTEIGPSPLGDENGTSYGIRVPDNYNGLLIIDLDYVTARNSARANYFLGKGYAYAGINRPPLRRTQYDPAKEIQNLLAVMDIFEGKFGKPKRVIHYGQSAGGQLALAMAELHPERIQGAVAGCATTPIWTSGVRFDLFFVLKALLDPTNDPQLGFLGLPNDSSEVVARWQELFTSAAQTAEGRARLALGIAIAQWNTWGVGLPRPDPSNVDDFEEHIRELAERLHAPHVNTQFIFETQVGVWIGNDGADYERYWQNADPALKKAVKVLYDRAGLDLAAEIAKVNSTPRVATNRANAEFWLSHNARTQRGTPQVPVFRFHTIGDPQVVVSQVEVYNDQIQRNGKTPIYRSGYVERQGHCSFTVAEAATALEVMIRRLDSGRWDSTNANNLNKIGQSLGTGTEPAFIEHNLRRFNGEWRLDY